MQSLVVFFAFAVAAHGSLLAQPPHLPAVVLDPHGRPLDTAEVINARALHLQAKALEPSSYLAHAAVPITPVAHSVIAPVFAAPAAVSHQSRIDVHSSPAILSSYAAPLLTAHSAYGLAGHGHLLKKRSLGYTAYSAPILAPSAVSHQSRVDVVSSPAVVSHAVAAPVLSHAVVAPVVAHAIAPAAVSHQSRVDIRTSPAIVSSYSAPVLAAAPVLNAHSAYASPILAHSAYASPILAHSAYGLAGHGHLLKKRSLGYTAYSAPILAPSAVSHQSRIDVVSSPAVVSHAVAAPILSHAVAAPVVAHAIAPAAVSHQSRVDVRTSPALAHSVVAAPLLHSSPLAYGPALHGHGLIHAY